MVVGVPVRHAPERQESRRAPLWFSLLGPGADIKPIVSLARDAHAESRFGYIPFSLEKVEAIIARIIANPARSACILATRGGVLWCSLGEYHIGSDMRLPDARSRSNL